MDTIEGFLEEDLRQLLTSTIRKYVDTKAIVSDTKPMPLAPGMSGAKIFLREVAYSDEQGTPSTISLVLKEAQLRERRAMNHFMEQAQPNIPFAYCPDLTTDGAVWTCIQYVGEIRRPTSLEPITAEYITAEAEALASIHSASLGKRDDLSWLAPLEPGFFEKELSWRWRPNWERVLQNEDFVREFSADIARIERAADRMPAEMSAMAQEESCLTIIHNDLWPIHVRVYQGRPYYIDWHAARFAPFYMDLPHHHCTLEQAEIYREAMAKRGVHITRDDFADRYRAAAKYAAFRWMDWTFEHWENDHSETAWVRHYFQLITD